MAWDHLEAATHKALMKLLNEGEFTIKGSSIAQFQMVLNWASALPVRYELKQKPNVPENTGEQGEPKSKKRKEKAA